MKLSRKELRDMIDRLPRVSLRPEPTPLEPAPRISDHLKGPRVWIKRDDQPCAALGGNKLRKLEFFLGEALNQGADAVVTLGAIHSNHVQVTAAACARLGLSCHALLLGMPPERPRGNLYLDHLFGAEITFLRRSLEDAPAEAVRESLDIMVSNLESRGRKPYVIPAGGSGPLGDVSYAGAFVEIARQARERDFRIGALVAPVGSMGTFSGLLLAKQLLGSSIPVIGIATSPAEMCRRAGLPTLPEMTARAAALLGREDFELRDDPEIYDEFIDPGYGRPSPQSLEAVRLCARLEGVLLDPVYSGKVLAGLMALASRGRFAPGEPVVFLHTGGVNELLVHPEWMFP